MSTRHFGRGSSFFPHPAAAFSQSAKRLFLQWGEKKMTEEDEKTEGKWASLSGDLQQKLSFSFPSRHLAKASELSLSRSEGDLGSCQMCESPAIS